MFFLALAWWLSSIFNQRPESYLLYAPWTLFSLLGLVIVICYTAFSSGSLTVFLASIIKIIWKGNLVIFFLIVPSLLLIRPGSGPYNLFFTSNTFWAYPTLILGITSLIQAKFMTNVKWKRLLLYTIYIICLIAVYFSARRSPLFMLLLSFVVLFIPFNISHLIVISGLVIVCFLTIEAINVKSFTSQLPNSYMKYRMERMFGLVKGRKETSYKDRQKIWKVYLNSFKAHPIFGVGLASNQGDGEGIPKKLVGYSAHNTFVGLLAETGIIGTLCFLLMVFRSLMLLSHSKSILWLKIYFILFLPTVLINWVEYNLIPGQIFFLYSNFIWLLPRGLVFLKKPEPI